MAEIANPDFEVGRIVGVASATGIVAAVAGDGSVVVLEKWDPVQGDATHLAPAGSAGGGGTRRHLFDREVYVDTGGAVYVNVRAWGSITGTPTTVAGYGITNAITTAGGQTIAGTLSTSGAITITTNATYFTGKTAGAVAKRIAGINASGLVSIDADAVGTTHGAGIVVAGAITTGTDNANDLGSASFRFRNGYFGGTGAFAGNVTVGANIRTGGTGAGANYSYFGSDGTSYSTIGYNANPSGTNAWTFAGPGVDWASWIQFFSGGFYFNTSSAQASSGSITKVSLFNVTQAGVFTVGTGFTTTAAGAVSGITTVSASSSGTFVTGTATATVRALTTGGGYGVLSVGQTAAPATLATSKGIYGYEGDTNLYVNGLVGGGVIVQVAGTVVGTFGAAALVINALPITGVTDISYSGTATASGTQILRGIGQTTSFVFARFQNAGGDLLFGVERSTAGGLFAADTAYASVFGSENATPVELATNGNARVRIDSSGNFVAVTDAVYDLGDGSHRFRDLTISRNAVIGGAVTVSTLASAGGLRATGISVAASGSAGEIIWDGASALFQGFDRSGSALLPTQLRGSVTTLYSSSVGGSVTVGGATAPVYITDGVNAESTLVKFFGGGGSQSFYITQSNNTRTNLSCEGEIRLRVGVTADLPYSTGIDGLIVSNTGALAIVGDIAATTAGGWTIGCNQDIILSRAGSEGFRVKTSGATQMIHYGAGAATFDASGNITSVSDDRQKTVLGPYAGGLPAVRKLRIYRTKFNELSGLDTENEYVNFLASNVGEAMPENVFAREEVEIDRDDDGEEIARRVVGHSLSIWDRGVLGATVNAVQELAGIVDRYATRLDALEAFLAERSGYSVPAAA